MCRASPRGKCPRRAVKERIAAGREIDGQRPRASGNVGVAPITAALALSTIVTLCTYGEAFAKWIVTLPDHECGSSDRRAPP
jgi:hypothetical protein